MTGISIVGFQDTEPTKRAVDYAATRAKASGGRLHLIYVLEWSPFSFHTPEELAERHKRREMELDRARAEMQPVLDKLKASGVEASCDIVHGNARELLCKAAEDKKASDIVIGRSGDSGLAQRLLGGLALTLAQVSPVPLIIVP